MVRDPESAAGVIPLGDPHYEVLLDQLAEIIRSGNDELIDVFLEDHPDQAEPLRQLLPTIRAVAMIRDSSDPRSSSAIRESGNRDAEDAKILGDFRIVREIGRGGMGVVYEAEQFSLPRRVALKVLPFAGVLDEKQLERFKNEARAAATLDHPGIVSVYTVGCERAVHFYAMQFVEGQSLAEVIAELSDYEKAGNHLSDLSEITASFVGGATEPTKQENGRETIGRANDETMRRESPGYVFSTPLGGPGVTHSPAYFRSVARLGVQAAEALDHAHARGIVHRDIKPGNLLLDYQANVHVADFGLARIEADAGITMTGDIVGTLRYMSPEQALAKRTLVDHRSDIYSLGATLYELATLTPPISGNDRQELLRKIAFEEPRCPCRINKSISSDLETIVVKAIAKNPLDRYATAQEMADDLRRFIESRPIRARRVGPTERLWRWSKRNPFIAALIGAVASLVTLVAIVTSIAYARTTAALAEAQHQGQLVAQERDRADRHFRAARDAVDRMLTTSAEDLVNVPHSGQVRRKLLEDALEFYQGFLEQKSSDPIIRHETALAYKRVGDIQRDLGARNSARDAYGEAVELLEGLLREYPKEAQYLSDLAECESSLGYTAIGRNKQENIRGMNRYLELSQQLVAEHPANPQYREMVVYGHTGLGNALQMAGRHQDAMPHFRQSVHEWEQLKRAFPQHPQDLDLLAHIHHWLGAALLQNNQLEEAETELRRALTLRKQLFEADRGSRSNRVNLAHISQWLAMLHVKRREAEEAEDLRRSAIALVEDLTNDFPADTEYRNRLAGLLHQHAKRSAANGRPDEAVLAYRRMLTHREAIRAADSDDRVIALELAQGYFRLGLLLHMENELDEEAHRSFLRTQQYYEALLEDDFQDYQVVDAMSSFLANCPASQFQDPARAIELLRPALQQASRNGDLWNAFGMAHHAAGNWNEAIDALNKAITLKGESQPWDLFPLAMSLWNLGEHGESRDFYDEAVKQIETHDLGGIPMLLLLRRQASELLMTEAKEPRFEVQ